MPDGQLGEREAYWFDTVDFERVGSLKFQTPAGVTYEKLVTNARTELRTNHPEAYKLFLLCLCAGLRRAEADVCLWTQLSSEDHSIRIEANEFIEPKQGSGGTVYVDPTLMKELSSFKTKDSETSVVNSTRGWKPVMYQRYRCEPHCRVLLGWLETNDISARKKVHELRKLFGDAIVKRNGIFAGSAQLRHSTIQMTSSHCTDPRQRAALPVGNLLSDQTTETVPTRRRFRRKTAEQTTTLVTGSKTEHKPTRRRSESGDSRPIDSVKLADFIGDFNKTHLSQLNQF